MESNTKKKQKRRHLTEKEKKDFAELWKYMKNLLGYDDNVPLPNFFALRLKGIQVGKYVENYSIKAVGSEDSEGSGGYIGFDIMLSTLKLYRSDIENGYRRNGITDVNYKFNYACKVMESHLQDVLDMMKKAEKDKNRIDDETDNDGNNDDFIPMNYDSVEYKNRNNKPKHNPLLDELW